MNPVRIIQRKRDGEALTEHEIEFFVRSYADDRIPDYQMAALAMAIFWRGMNVAETAHLTRQMIASGTPLLFQPGPRSLVDKHSTGGIGDKTSLILAPLLACCDLRVPMISGRGLGATGGTLDKLESIPGFRTDLDNDEIAQQVNRIGCVITGATNDIAPADKKLYGLRDVTATVASIPLITASIMSKKLSEGLEALVLDVKCGAGAFMKTLPNARALADSLVATGSSMGVATSALLTDMNQPLGSAAGNAIEVHESMDVLQGAGPHDLRDLSLELGCELLVIAGAATDHDSARRLLERQLDSGQAFQKFAEMVAAQGGDLSRRPRLAAVRTLVSQEAGYIRGIASEELGWLLIEMGAGRKSIEDQIRSDVGIAMQVRIGDRVDPGQPLLDVFCDDINDNLRQRLAAVFDIDKQPVDPPPLVIDRIATG